MNKKEEAIQKLNDANIAKTKLPGEESVPKSLEEFKKEEALTHVKGTLKYLFDAETKSMEAAIQRKMLLRQLAQSLGVKLE